MKKYTIGTVHYTALDILGLALDKQLEGVHPVIDDLLVHTNIKFYTLNVAIALKICELALETAFSFEQCSALAASRR